MSNIDPELLKRYANDDCSDSEQELVNDWLQKTTEIEDADLFKRINKDTLKEQIWANVKPTQSHVSKKLLPPYFYKIAACIALVCLTGVFIYKYDIGAKKKQPINEVSIYKELFVSKGRKASITLTDGTIVVLNSDTRFRYPEEFDGTVRKVYLSGEAYFKVAKDPARPFVIHTDKTETTVLGTVFNLKAYAEEKQTVLTVEEGKVKFALNADKNSYLMLTINDQGIAGKNKLVQQHVYAAAYSGWQKDKLIFNDLPLAEVSALLCRKYDVKVSIKSKEIEIARFTGVYEGASLVSIAEDIRKTLHCNYKLNNGTLNFY